MTFGRSEDGAEALGAAPARLGAETTGCGTKEDSG